VGKRVPTRLCGKGGKGRHRPHRRPSGCGRGGPSACGRAAPSGLGPVGERGAGGGGGGHTGEGGVAARAAVQLLGWGRGLGGGLWGEGVGGVGEVGGSRGAFERFRRRGGAELSPHDHAAPPDAQKLIRPGVGDTFASEDGFGEAAAGGFGFGWGAAGAGAGALGGAALGCGLAAVAGAGPAGVLGTAGKEPQDPRALIHPRDAGHMPQWRTQRRTEKMCPSPPIT